MPLKNIFWKLAKVPILGGFVLACRRFVTSGHYVLPPVLRAAKWSVTSREISNFTYELTELNRRYLSATLSVVTGADATRIAALCDELDSNNELRRHIRERVNSSMVALVTDQDARYGRRIGWYAVIRLLKPKLVVEVGVAQGLGACVICEALRRNCIEGSNGRYLGIDIDPGAGWLLGDRYKDRVTLAVGDAITELAKIDEPIEVYVNDGDHSSRYETNEYNALAGKLAAGGIVLGDNAHCSDSLLAWSSATGRQFLYFAEEPTEHWYPGGGIGFSFKPDLLAQRVKLSEGVGGAASCGK